MPVIDCTSLGRTYGNRTILENVTLTLRSGEHVGLVGNNGSGKSTLGRLLAGLEEPDTGSLARRRGAFIDYLAQEPALPERRTISDIVVSSLEAWSAAKQRYDDLTAALADGEPGTEDDTPRLISEQAAAGEEVERLGGWERLHEAETIISHLGISDSSRLAETLSGGERRRVALARILVGAPDLAILDEPTNHLDIETIEWLEDYLQSRFKGAILLITHDRYLLDSVTTRTLELSDGAIASYKGGYAQYLEAKAERVAHSERTERNRQNFLRRELEWLRRQPKARGTKQKARTGRAEEALNQEAPKREREADLRLASERLGKTILELSGLRIERGGLLLVDALDLAMAQGERIGIVGSNGCGKTSLLLCLLGELEKAGGSFAIGANTRIGYLDQARDGLTDDETVRECVAGDRSSIEIAGETLRVGAYLERFLFDGSAQRRKVGVLSGGERARVCLAKLLWQKTNFLLLDEPTNDLDVATLAALESMLLDFAGSALVVSHDRWFLDRIATSILSFEGDGVVDLHRGSYSDYRRRRDAQARARAASAGKAARVEKARASAERASASATATSSGRPKKLTFAEERELGGLFERIEAAEGEVDALAAKLSDPDTYSRAGATITDLTASLDEARERVSALTTRWEELEARKV